MAYKASALTDELMVVSEQRKTVIFLWDFAHWKSLVVQEAPLTHVHKGNTNWTKQYIIYIFERDMCWEDTRRSGGEIEGQYDHSTLCICMKFLRNKGIKQ